MSCVPGNVAGFVAYEIAHIKGVPKRLVGFKWLGVQGQDGQGFTFSGFYHRIGIGCPPTQYTQCVVVEVFKQLGFPRVPNLGAGAANICHCQQVQRCQVSFVANAFGKCSNHFWVAQVFFLGNPAHAQVFAHQELGELCIFKCNAVLPAKHAHVVAAQL